MIDRSFIGLSSEVRYADVEKGQMVFFAQIIGETNPIYLDEEAAVSAGHPTIPAAPTFGFTLELLAPRKRGTLKQIGVDLRRLLHGEQSFTYHRQIYAGDRIALVTVISDIYEKKEGALEFVTLNTTHTNQRDELVLETCSTLIIRNK